MNNFWDGYIAPSVLYDCEEKLLPDVKRLTMYYAFCLAHFEREVEVMAELKKKRRLFRFASPKYRNVDDLVGQFVLVFLMQRYLLNVMIFHPTLLEFDFSYKEARNIN